MNKKDRTETIELIADALNEVVIPAIEDVEKRLTDKMNGLASKEDIGRIERKLNAMEDRLDRHGVQLEKHEKEIKKLQVVV